MSRIIKTTFQLRRGLKNDWETINPLLAYGEPGFEVDTNKLKIGNGLEEWNDLEYLTGGSSTSGADWDAAEGQPGYIANRPFYSTNQTQSAVVSFTSGTDSSNADHTTADTPSGDMFGEDVPYYMDETWPSMSTTAGQFVTDVVNLDIEDITVVFEGGSITYHYNADLTNTYPDLNSDITKWYVDSTDNPTSLLYLASSQDYACGAVGIVVKWEIASTLFPNADIPAEEPQDSFDSFSYGDLTLQVQTEVVHKLDSKFLPDTFTSGAKVLTLYTDGFNPNQSYSLYYDANLTQPLSGDNCAAAIAVDPDIVYISNGGTRILATQWGFNGDANDYSYDVMVPYGYKDNVNLIQYHESSFGSAM